MSTINNIPFDINATASEKNALVKRTGTVPLYHSDATHPISHYDKHPDRFSSENRRKVQVNVSHNRRLLIERRETLPISEELPVNVHTSGSIINFKV